MNQQAHIDINQATKIATQNNGYAKTKTADFLADIESQLKSFEQHEKQRLQLEHSRHAQWRDTNPNIFTAEQRAHTTILHAGLTMAHDLFIQSAFRGLGYKVSAMAVPDNQSLQLGREFGNRGQCNPTYFTVGNLVKKLQVLHAQGIPKQDIIDNYVFATAGSCGPCRFGTYVTEYRKALRDAGFEGFRVILFQQAGGIKQATGQEMGLKIDATFFLTMTRAIILGDVLNALSYRIRPYECEPGATDTAIANAKARIAQAFEQRRGLLKALWITRKELAAIKVDRTQVKPKVAIIGEFWAMTTEGDGNYKMHRFLENEGAEVDIQLVVNWGLYLLWGAKYDTLERAQLKGTDDKRDDNTGHGSKFALQGVNVKKKLLTIKAGELVMRGLFYCFAKILGLRNYHLPDMDHIAQISHAFYDNNLRGGEGHMEVGKLIQNVVHNKVNMTLSIKPFGCMPSSAVSDGVQSLITELYPKAIFLPIETNGDGAVNVYSRVQMQLFKARQAAQRDITEQLEKMHWNRQDFVAASAGNSKFNSATYTSPHAAACSAGDLLTDIQQRQNSWHFLLGKLARLLSRRAHKHKIATVKQVQIAAEKFKHDKQASPNNTPETVVKFVEPA